MPEIVILGAGKVILQYLSIVILKYEARSGGKEKDEDASSKLLYAKAETSWSCCVERGEEPKHRKARNPVFLKLPQQLPNNISDSENRTTLRKDPKYRSSKSQYRSSKWS